MSRQFLKIICVLFILIFFCLFALFCYYQKQEQHQSIAPAVEINNIIIPVELVDTPEKHIQGLSDRKELNGGMLFLFDERQVRSFWMKNMHFPIDIIWISHRRVVNISKNLQPEGKNPKKTYSSIYPVYYVLEVNAGFCEENNISIGDRVKIIK